MNTKRAMVAGLIATCFATVLWLVLPWIGLPKWAVGEILSSFLGVLTAYTSVAPAIGWLLHFVVGVGLALVYAMLFVSRLPGSPIVRGALYGVLIFLVAQVTVMPLVGAGMFARGDLPVLIGALFGHLVYGGLLGAIYGGLGSSTPVLKTA